jgi:hypothetical protein
MSKGGKLILEADDLLKLAENIEDIAKLLRILGTEGLITKPELQNIDIYAIDWMKKDREKANPEDSWVWAFAYDMDGKLRPETKYLVQYIQQYGEAEIDGFKITLSGSDEKLLNRKKLKT